MAALEESVLDWTELVGGDSDGWQGHWAADTYGQKYFLVSTRLWDMSGCSWELEAVLLIALGFLGLLSEQSFQAKQTNGRITNKDIS